VPDALLEAPVLESLDGSPLSARDLEAQMVDNHGLIYGVVPEVAADLEGLDRGRILDLDLQKERMLIAILGEGSYVRVDSRDVLAEVEGVVVRDVALGLRSYPDFPLLVEGADPSALPPDRRGALEHELVQQLVDVFLGSASAENRRQAARHLTWYVVNKATGGGGDLPQGLVGLPLFLDASGAPRSWREIAADVASDDGIPMHDGWAVDPADLGALIRESLDDDEVEPYQENDGLAMSPFVYHVLASVGRVTPVFDFDLSKGEAAANVESPEVAFLIEATVDDDLATGVVGLPADEVAETAIAVVDPSSRRVGALLGPAREMGIVGRLQLRGSDATELEVERLGRRAGLQVMRALVDEIPSMPAGSKIWRRCVATALRFAWLHVGFTAEPDGRVVVEVLDSTAEQVLDLPLFPTTTGVSVSAFRLLDDWARSLAPGAAPPVHRLGADAHELLSDWVNDALDVRHVVRPASTPSRQVPAVAKVEGVDDAALGRWLTETIEALRPDPSDGGVGTKVVVLADVREPQSVGGVTFQPMKKDQLYQLLFSHGRPHIGVNGRHWLVGRWKKRAEQDPEAAVWLLLSCYAYLNDYLVPVTNDHELDFQRRVVELLGKGELGVAG